MLAPSTGGYLRIENEYLQRYDTRLDTVLVQVRALIDSGQGDQLMPNTDFFYCPKARVSANTFYEYYRTDSAFTKMPDYLRALRIPALVIAASHDERQPDVIKSLSPVADGDKVKMVVIENAGHFFRDLNIEEAIEYTVEFIEGSS